MRKLMDTASGALAMAGISITWIFALMLGAYYYVSWLTRLYSSDAIAFVLASGLGVGLVISGVASALLYSKATQKSQE